MYTKYSLTLASLCSLQVTSRYKSKTHTCSCRNSKLEQAKNFCQMTNAMTQCRSDEEKLCTKATLIKEANDKYIANLELRTRYLCLNDKSNPITRKDESNRLAIAWNVDPKKWATKHLDKLIEFLAPGTVIESTALATNMMQHGF